MNNNICETSKMRKLSKMSETNKMSEMILENRLKPRRTRSSPEFFGPTPSRSPELRLRPEESEFSLGLTSQKDF
jgi:hypothetical protein